jgi:hypothetical protein
MSLVLVPTCGFSEETETNYWQQISFLSSTASVSRLSQELNDLSLPPLTRFHALCAMFINNVRTGESLTNFASLADVSFDWVDQAEVEPNLMNKKGRPIHYTLSFTNALADWGGYPIVRKDRDRPRFFVGLVNAPPVRNRTRKTGISFFKGVTDSCVSSFCFYTDWGDKWVIFSRDERGDYLRVHAATDGSIYRGFRKTLNEDGQQKGAR